VKKILLVALVAACGPKGPFPAADPLRPPAQKVDSGGPVAVTPVVAADCDPLAPAQGAPAVAYKDRDEVGAQSLYKQQALPLLKNSEDSANPGGPPSSPDAQDAFLAAVKKFQEGLAMDPYNAHLTYNLAAAYARIGKNQCALNLLARLASFSKWPSRKANVQDCYNALTGHANFSGKGPDPDFDGLRGDDRFKAIVKSF
jgi:hypothetical protein